VQTQNEAFKAAQAKIKGFTLEQLRELVAVQKKLPKWDPVEARRQQLKHNEAAKKHAASIARTIRQEMAADPSITRDQASERVRAKFPGFLWPQSGPPPAPDASALFDAVLVEAAVLKVAHAVLDADPASGLEAAIARARAELGA